MKLRWPKLRWPARNWLAAAAIAGAVTIALPYIIHVEHQAGSWESVPGWWPLFGAFGCAAIIVVSKLLGKLMLSKTEGWYESPSEPSE